MEKEIQSQILTTTYYHNALYFITGKLHVFELFEIRHNPDSLKCGIMQIRKIENEHTKISLSLMYFLDVYLV